MSHNFETAGGPVGDTPMIGDVDTNTIGWLLPEIGHAFDAATAALRQFRAGAAGVDRDNVDLAPLRVARTHLHQAHGALELSEIAGVTRVTEAIEALLVVFEEDPARCDANAMDAVVGGCRTTVEYLEDLQTGSPQQPLFLFASYRELLAVRGVDRIHPADLFRADLGIRVGPRDEKGTSLGLEALSEQRRLFEQALLRYIRNEHDTAALANLARAVTAIERSVGSAQPPAPAQQRTFWWVTRALFEALANDGFATAQAQHGHIKRVAGRVNLQIRKLSEGSSAVAERLFADALFFVAIATPVTPLVRDVQERFHLVDAVPSDFEKQRYGRIDGAAVKSAREALVAAKSAWTGVVGGDVGQIPDFAKHTSALVDAVGALRRRGLARVAQVIDGIATDLGFDPRQPAPSVGLDVATALLFFEGALERARLLDDAFDQRADLVVARLEASATGQEHAATPVDWLDKMAREAEERLTVASFAGELQANLQSAEKELDAFFRDTTQKDGLVEAQKALAQVGGALALLGHDDVHHAIDHARAAISRFQEGEADPAAFDGLAQSLGAVGFYVDQIKRDRVDLSGFSFDRESGRLVVAPLRRVARPVLAVDVPFEARQTTIEATPIVQTQIEPVFATPEQDLSYSEIAFAATQVLDSAETLEEEIANRATDSLERATRLRATPDDRVLRDQLAAAVDDVRRNAALIDDRVLQDDAAGVLATLRRAGHEPMSAAVATQLADAVAAMHARAQAAAGIAAPAAEPIEPVVAVPSEEEHEAIDAELLEIFLEEAGGVLVDAESALRVLDADPYNSTATMTLRRGFHTLKGSSRMVGLNAFGDGAWAVEDTLNAHIADQKPASSDLRALIEYAIRMLAGWVDELRTTGSSSRSPEMLIEGARAVRTGGSIGQVAAPPAPAPVPEVAPVVEPAKLDESVYDQAFAATEVLELSEPETPLPTLEEEDFEKTLILGDDEDPAFAKTQLMVDPLDESPSFFGEQPAHRTARDEAFDEPFAPLFDATHEARVEAPAEAAHEPVAEPAPVAEDAPSLDWLQVPGEAVEAAHEAVVEPVSSEEPVAIEHAAEAVTELHDEPQVATSDDVRRIGSLTLSTALFNIYLTEADELLRVLSRDFESWRDELDRFVSEAAMRAAHSLAGSSSTVGLEPAHDLAAAIEDVLLALYREPRELTEAQVACLADATESLTRMLHRFAAERMPDAEPAQLAALRALRQEVAAEAAHPFDAAPSQIAPVAEPLPFEPLDFDVTPSERAESVEEAEPVTAETFAEHAEAAEVPAEAPFEAHEVEAPGAEVSSHESLDEHVASEEPIADPRTPHEAEPVVAHYDEPAVVESVEQTPVVESFGHHDTVPSFADDTAHAFVGEKSDEPSVAEESAFVEEGTVEAPAIETPVVASTEQVEQATVESPAAEPVSVDPFESEHAEHAEHAEPVEHAEDAPAEHALVEHVEHAQVEQTHVEDAPVEAAHHAFVQDSDADVESASDEVVEPGIASFDAIEPVVLETFAPVEVPVAARVALPSERESTVRDDIDPELLDVFVEEGNEIFPQVGALLRTWQANRSSEAPSRMLLRHLHTLKGSARMAGAMRLGEVVHDIEARVESAARLKDVPAALIEELLAAHDRSLELFDALHHPMVAEPVAAPHVAEASAVSDADAHAESADADVPSHPVVEQIAETAAGVAAESTDAAAAPGRRDAKQGTQQVVRVPSETLDRLVNLAGEVSISRARIENEVSQIKTAMSDLSDNIERLRAQLREIELQAEFQMQSRMSHQSGGEEREKFDPLEFDRFTRFQELTRMMAESVNDVKTVQTNLARSLDVAEFDLTSQRRMTRDLQHDLMQVRMVPFGSIAERLFRVARRASKELDKRVNLDIRGGNVELDRGVLERMAGPFEHLLRNHIVHGIESREARRAAGKSEMGELLVEVRQEGNEIVLVFSDDGAGLDYDRIRSKGRELGLIGEQPLNDAQAAELIFHPGFSTATEVTELAGRGVGMDVVRAEAIELAGRVSVDSEPGRGTRFTINLPLTLAVTQVVLVSVASRVYALPAVLVEQVQQFRPQPLAEAYRTGHIKWADADVRLAFLGTLLGIDESVPVAQRTSPVLILRSAGDRVAVHVDEVVGNQEVVVKNLGPQLARMTGIAGATVLGSGEIVLILNPVQLAQMPRPELIAPPRPTASDEEQSTAPAQPTVAPYALQTLPTVMVVDDSLTVRRVTQRLLSREGYQVVLAKDGVDALEQLQDYPPDVMLVDIEMPRMDGFDLTRNVRNDERYRGIPIIMITSRTAEKHREHALQLGVDAYLGKPYQEEELLELLAKFVRERRMQTA